MHIRNRTSGAAADLPDARLPSLEAHAEGPDDDDDDAEYPPLTPLPCCRDCGCGCPGCCPCCCFGRRKIKKGGDGETLDAEQHDKDAGC